MLGCLIRVANPAAAAAVARWCCSDFSVSLHTPVYVTLFKACCRRVAL